MDSFLEKYNNRYASSLRGNDKINVAKVLLYVNNVEPGNCKVLILSVGMQWVVKFT